MARRKSEVTKALAKYRLAVRATAWAEEHGTHGDGRVADALAKEKKALSDVRSAIRLSEEGRRYGAILSHPFL